MALEESAVREREPDEGERHGKDDHREERDVPTPRDARQVAGDGVVDEEWDEEA